MHSSVVNCSPHWVQSLRLRTTVEHLESFTTLEVLEQKGQCTKKAIVKYRLNYMHKPFIFSTNRYNQLLLSVFVSVASATSAASTVSIITTETSTWG